MSETDTPVPPVEAPQSLQKQLITEAISNANRLASSDKKQVRDAMDQAGHQIDEWRTWEGNGDINREQFDRLAQAAIAEARLSTVFDPLTGLLNRTGLSLRMNDLASRAQRFGDPLSVLYVDLEGFKALNDTVGHHAGDFVLQATAEYLQGTVRGIDVVGRLGGDEYVIGISESKSINRKNGNGEKKESARDRIIREIAENYPRFVAERMEESGIDTGSVHIGARVGVAEYQKGEDISDLIKRADADMNSKRDPNKPSR
ncbi:MAG: GGDEF domain-containing protein [Candidatus Levybacteria bacterium]|nr:GGDEF domain-containing protein [Candidatus Levybacteria bacterium]